MARVPRSKVFDPNTIGIYHCWNRVVRQAFLMGHDKVTGRHFDHRREWVLIRLRLLASIFAIDHLNFAILGNHLHVLLRNRPDIRDGWSDEEVVQRWWRLFPGRRDEHGMPATLEPEQLDAMLANPAWVKERRNRLGDISWFMRCLAEHIANRANSEENISSRFWQGRFKMIRILDECALLACAVYIDLNPIRAQLAETPETSAFTSVYERLQQFQICQSTNQGTEKHDPTATDPTEVLRDEWLSPVKLDKNAETTGAQPTHRASNRGYLEMTFAEYLALVDWTGRQVRADKHGSIPADLAPIFDRLQINGEVWVEAITHFNRWFKSAAGRVESMAKEAARRGQRFLQGRSHCRKVFS